MLDRGPRTLIVSLIATAFVSVAAPVTAYARQGTTERVSIGDGGGEIPSGATSPSITADGRFVAFVSAANDIVPEDQNSMFDVFVRDRVLGTTIRASVGNDEKGANAMSLTPSISSDGRYVLFISAAPFDPRDTNNNWDPYVRDLHAGTTSLAVVGTDNKAVPWGIGDAHMSDDSRIITFATGSKVLPADTNDTFDVYAVDRLTGAIELVSVNAAGTSGNGESYWNDISGDGRSVVFYSFSSNLIPNDTNGVTDVFVRDLANDRTLRLSVTSDGTEGNASSFLPDVSDDGRYVAFVSYASNLVPNDSNPINDVFVHDRVTRTTERVSVASDGSQAANTGLTSSWEPAISGDGRYVAFASSASNLVSGDTNGIGDFFVHDRMTGSTERISVASDGTQMTSNNSSASPAISNGRHVAFTSNATNLVPGDGNANYDVFVRDRGPAAGVGRLDVSRTDDAATVSGWATFSGARLLDADDDDRDGRAPAPGISAGDVGAELTGASITYRPEPGDLLVRWRLSRLPGVAGPAPGVDPNLIVSGGAVPSIAGAPGILYGASFVSAGVRYEVRGLRAGATGPGAGAPAFALYRCAPDCSEAGRLTGSFGSTGVEVRAVIPLSAIAASEGQRLEAVSVFAAVGEAAAGTVLRVDDASLGQADIPRRSLAAGVGEANGPPDEMPVGITLSGDGPGFTGTVPLANAGSDPRIWVRACLGDTCSLAWAPIP